MGWTGYYHKVDDVKAEMRRIWSQQNRYEIVADSMNGSTYYAALRHHEKPDVVFALVCLTKNPKDGFMYKEMDETVGPCECKPSQAVLRALTETTYEHALEWRKRAWEYHQHRLTTSHKASKIEEGDVVVYAPDGVEQTIGYGSYGKFSRFRATYRRVRRNKTPSLVFYPEGTSFLVRIRRDMMGHLMKLEEFRKAVRDKMNEPEVATMESMF